MRTSHFWAWCLSAAVLLAGAAEKEQVFNLLPGSEFKPMRMDGEITGLENWSMIDFGRIAITRDPKQRRLPDGREIFKLDCKDGVFSINFKKDVPAGYYQYRQPLHLYPVFSNLPVIPAERYRMTGSFKLSAGSLLSIGRKTFKASPEWQKVDYTFPPGTLFMNLNPVPGTSFAMKDFRVTAEYPKIGGSILLPDGGRLSSLILPKNAPYVVKRLVYCWRGWLWSLTGTALPVYERDRVRPQKDALVFMPGKIPNNGYDFKLDKDGGTLVYGWPFAINNALFNYLRKFGYIEYDRFNRTAMPARDPRRPLPAAETKFRPKFSFHTESGSYTSPGYPHGTVGMRDLFTGVANWYALPKDTEHHCSSQLLPPPDRLKQHPESLMMYADGRRQTELSVKDPMHVSPCLTDEQTRNYLLDRIMDVFRNRSCKSVFPYALGDLPDAFCHCPRCRQVNEDKSGKGYASVFYRFMCDAADRAGKEFPGKEIAYCAYHTYAIPPVNKKVPDNMAVDFCVTGIEKPCNLHLDCPVNNAGGWRAHLNGWTKVAPRERIGVLTYDTHNPFLIMEIFAELNKYASRSMHMFTNSPIEQDVAARWNQGDDPAKIVQEYNDGVFGADAGKYVTAVQRLVYEYDRKYQHRPGEFTGGVGRMRYRESLDRKTFDAVYALFDQAEKTIRARKGDVVPLLWEKFEFMTADLRKYSRSGCVTDADLKAFALRVAEFIRISSILCRSKKYPYRTAGTRFTAWSYPARTFLQMFCGMNLPATKTFWTDEPAVVKFMKNPVENMTGNPEKTPGHWKFQHIIMRGGENAAGGKVLRRQSSGKGQIVCSLKLENDLRGVALLTLSGWDDEKPGKTTFRILVNGKEIFSGANSFPESGSLQPPAGYMYFPIPAGLLKKGENLIALVNTVKDDPAKAVRQLKNPAQPEDGYMLKQDYFWGWLALNELRVTAPDDEFLKFAEGKPGSAWTVHRYHRPPGKIVNASGKVSIQSAGARYTGIIVPLVDTRWLLPKGVKFKMRIKVTGKGLFNAGLICYPADAAGNRLKSKMQYSTVRFKLTGNPQTFEKVVENKALGYCCPNISIVGDGSAVISEFSLTPFK